MFDRWEGPARRRASATLAATGAILILVGALTGAEVLTTLDPPGRFGTVWDGLRLLALLILFGILPGMMLAVSVPLLMDGDQDRGRRAVKGGVALGWCGVVTYAVLRGLREGWLAWGPEVLMAGGILAGLVSARLSRPLDSSAREEPGRLEPPPTT